MAAGNNRDKVMNARFVRSSSLSLESNRSFEQITSNMDEEGIPYDDPRFVEILEACLHVEIAAYKESYGSKK